MTMRRELVDNRSRVIIVALAATVIAGCAFPSAHEEAAYEELRAIEAEWPAVRSAEERERELPDLGESASLSENAVSMLLRAAGPRSS